MLQSYEIPLGQPFNFLYEYQNFYKHLDEDHSYFLNIQIFDAIMFFLLCSKECENYIVFNNDKMNIFNFC